MFVINECLHVHCPHTQVISLCLWQKVPKLAMLALEHQLLVITCVKLLNNVYVMPLAPHIALFVLFTRITSISKGIIIELKLCYVVNFVEFEESC